MLRPRPRAPCRPECRGGRGPPAEARPPRPRGGAAPALRPEGRFPELRRVRRRIARAETPVRTTSRRHAADRAGVAVAEAFRHHPAPRSRSAPQAVSGAARATRRQGGPGQRASGLVRLAGSGPNPFTLGTVWYFSVAVVRRPQRPPEGMQIAPPTRPAAGRRSRRRPSRTACSSRQYRGPRRHLRGRRVGDQQGVGDQLHIRAADEHAGPTALVGPGAFEGHAATWPPSPRWVSACELRGPNYYHGSVRFHTAASPGGRGE
jgi:hypothetical protein